MKTRALIRCTVTMQLTFVFAYAKGRFSHDEAHLMGPINFHYFSIKTWVRNTIVLLMVMTNPMIWALHAPSEHSNQPGHPPILSLCYTVHVLNWYLRAFINSFLHEDIHEEHYENAPMQHTAIFHGCKNDSFRLNLFCYFHIFTSNIHCGYTLEPPEYPYSMF